MDGIERRIHTGVGIELRKKSETNSAVVLRGYAAKFEVLSEPMWGFRERIAKGAFDDVLGDDVRALFNHDASHVLGRTKSGTLTIAQDDTGLAYEVELPDTSSARDLIKVIERGDVDQSSFAFTVEKDNWTEDDDGRIIRTIEKMKRLYDVSPVTYPAYPDATVGVRSMESWKATRSTQQTEIDLLAAAELKFKQQRESSARARRLRLTNY